MDLMILYGYKGTERMTYMTNWTGYQDIQQQLAGVEGRVGTVWLKNKEAYPVHHFKDDIIVEDLDFFINQLTY